MPILRPAVPFTAESAASSPRHAGVYGFYDEEGAAVFFGAAKDSIREELTRQIPSKEEAEGSLPLTVSWEVTAAPQQRCRDLIDEHIRSTGGPPAGNEG